MNKVLYFISFFLLFIFLAGCKVIPTYDEYTITYVGNGNDGGSVPDISIENITGDTVDISANSGSLTKTNSHFVNWNTAADGSGTRYREGEEYTFGSNNLTLYAHWAAALTYDGNSNTGGQLPVESFYPEGTSIIVSHNIGNLEKTGSHFIGWNSADNGSGTAYAPGDSIIMGDAPITLYAQWTTALEFSVTYDGNGSDSGSVPTESLGNAPGVEVPIVGNTGSLVKTGYNFHGWNTKADGSGLDYHAGSNLLVIITDITLYAKWIMPSTYTVTYMGNGNNYGNAPTDINTYEEGHAAVIKGPDSEFEKILATFSGWNTRADGTGTHYNAGDHYKFVRDTHAQISDLTLYAEWTDVGSVYSLVYKKNDGIYNVTGDLPDLTHGYRVGDTVTVLGNTGNLVNTYTDPTFEFVGWNTKDDGTGEAYVAGDTFVMPEYGKTLYAHWSIEDTSSLTFHANGADSGTVPVASHVYINGIYITAPANTGALTRAGYVFDGWKETSGDGGSAQYNPLADLIKVDISDIYAHWYPVKSIIYNGNGNTGGSAPVDSLKHKEDNTVEILSNINNLVKSNATFIGWNTAADGSGTAYSQGAVIQMPATDLLLYAQWQPGSSITIAGTVDDALTGSALDGVDVSLSIQGDLSSPYNATSDASGNYAITGIPSTTTGSYHLEFSKVGYSDTHLTFLMGDANVGHISMSPVLSAGEYRAVLNWKTVDTINLIADQIGTSGSLKISSTVSTIPGGTFDFGALAYGPQTLTIDTGFVGFNENVQILFGASFGTYILPGSGAVMRIYDSTGLVQTSVSNTGNGSTTVWGAISMKYVNSSWIFIVNDWYY